MGGLPHSSSVRFLSVRPFRVSVAGQSEDVCHCECCYQGGSRPLPPTPGGTQSEGQEFSQQGIRTVPVESFPNCPPGKKPEILWVRYLWYGIYAENHCIEFLIGLPWLHWPHLGLQTDPIRVGGAIILVVYLRLNLPQRRNTFGGHRFFGI